MLFHHPHFLCEKTLQTCGLPVTISTVILLNPTVYSTVLVFLYMTDVDHQTHSRLTQRPPACVGQHCEAFSDSRLWRSES